MFVNYQRRIWAEKEQEEQERLQTKNNPDEMQVDDAKTETAVGSQQAPASPQTPELVENTTKIEEGQVVSAMGEDVSKSDSSSTIQKRVGKRESDDSTFLWRNITQETIYPQLKIYWSDGMVLKILYFLLTIRGHEVLALCTAYYLRKGINDVKIFEIDIHVLALPKLQHQNSQGSINYSTKFTPIWLKICTNERLCRSRILIQKITKH